MNVLGIETSCDETAIAVVRNGQRVLSSEVASSLLRHAPFGGIVPEIATRAHVECLTVCLDKALKDAGLAPRQIDLVAVTYVPGLVGALVTGLSLAKALSFALGRPLVGVDHTIAHLYPPFLLSPAGRNHAGRGKKNPPRFPFVGLVVSGGHTSIFIVKDFMHYRLAGQTQDDACGEAFDKVAKILGLGYPGGPVIEKRAQNGNPAAIMFPRSYISKDSFDFSFSGIKTAVLYYVQQHADYPLSAKRYPLINDICASFQDAVFDVIVNKTIRAAEKYKIHTIVVGGGVSINCRLRALFRERLRGKKIDIYFPQATLCLDNAAMVAGLGYVLYKKGKRSPLALAAEAHKNA